MLISTSSLDLIVTGAKVMVDGAVFDFKIVEEGGFSLGEDACLSDEEESQEDLERGEDRNFDELNAHGDVDNLLNHLAEEWKTEKQDSQACQTSPLKEFPSIRILCLKRIHPSMFLGVLSRVERVIVQVITVNLAMG